MEIKASASLSHSPLAVFTVFRDHMVELAEYIPNVEAIELVERHDLGDSVTEVLNRWQGTKDDAPRLVRPFVSKRAAAWFDLAAWDEKTLMSQWKNYSVIEGVMICVGVTRIEAGGDGTLFTMDGDLTLYPERVPGVPKFVARRLKDRMERFIAARIEPNMRTTAQAVQRFLDDRGESFVLPAEG